MSNIKVSVDFADIACEFITFSDGTETCKLTWNCSDSLRESASKGYGNLRIAASIEDGTRDIIRIGLAIDAGRRFVKSLTSELHLRYVPQARADRVFEVGQPLPIKVFADIINSYAFDGVVITDPHSDVTSALINNVRIIDQPRIVDTNNFRLQREFSYNFILCAPDIGAAKKINDVCRKIEHNEYIQALKIRDVTTGNIIKCQIENPELCKGREVVIVDDISDGGASFIHLARKLKEAGAKTVALMVTHGIFAKGLDVISKDIDYLLVDNIVGTYITKDMIKAYNDEHAEVRHAAKQQSVLAL